jgi:hypothetical protein
LSGVASGFAVTEGNIQRVISVDSSIDTTVTTSAEAQITIPVTAQATAIAESSADAQLTYSVNATATAIAETTSEAQITRIISAEATATAESSADANFGITFNAGIEATANVVNADIFRAATMEASITGSANTTSVLTLADNLAASVSGTATVTNSNLQLFDANFTNVSLLLHGNGTNGSTTFTDSSSNVLTVTGVGNSQIDTSVKQFGTGSLKFDGNGDYLETPDNNVLDLSGDFTIELFFRLNTISNNGEHQTFIVKGDPELANNFSIQILDPGTSVTLRSNATGIISANISISINTFYHFAITRSGSNLRMYLNGNQIGSTVTNTTNFTNSNVVRIGGRNINSYGGYLNGYLDDLRITKGIARYTGSTYTVPTREFLDQ